MNIANVLSFLRLIITIINVVLFSTIMNTDNTTARQFVLLIITILFTIGIISDFLDGYLARKYNLITNLGKFIDPIADKILITSTLLMLCLYSFFAYSFLTPYKIWLFLCITIIITRDIIVDFIRFIAIEHQIVLSANMWGKVKTTSQMLAILLLLLSILSGMSFLSISGMVLLFIATLLTIYSGFVYLIQIKKFLK